MKLRPYQGECIDAIFDFFRNHPNPEDNPVAALPTGTGKSLVIAGFVERVLKTWPGQRIAVLTHVKELIEQNADKMKTLWPQCPLGIFSAGLGSKVAHMPVTFGGVQSIAKALPSFGHTDILLIDECHLVSPDEEGSYKKVIAYLRARNPYLRIIGLSATPYRLGLGMITDGGIFTHICYDITSLSAFNRLLDDGYLSPLIPMPTETKLDVAGVHKRGGEFIEKELQNAVNQDEVTKAAIKETIRSAAHRNHWLIFATGIDHANSICATLQDMGITAAVVHNKVTATERDANITAFKTGQTRALVNANVLTTGFDFPALDCIVLLRPTNSPVLHVQILGRGTRPLYANGFDLDTVEGRLAAIANSAKQTCLVLDFAGNTMRLGPINDPRIPKKAGEGTGDIPVKVCNTCGCMNHISARVCANCDEPFSFEVKITEKASTAALIVRDEPVVTEFKVDRITYAKHKRPGHIASLKVSYYCGPQRFTEYICLEHHGSKVLPKAHAWWIKRSAPTAIPPMTVDEALEQVQWLKTPSQIKVWVNTKFPEILSANFNKEP